MVTEYHTELSKRIDEVCRDNNLTYNKLAKLLGISSTTFYQISSGRTKQLSIDVLIKFYQLLGVDIAWLATGEGNMLNTTKQLEAEKGSLIEDDALSTIMHDVQEMKMVFGEQLRAKDRQIEKLLDLLGKLEGAIDQPLRPGMESIEGVLRKYIPAGLSQVRANRFFLAPPVAKLVAPRCLE